MGAEIKQGMLFAADDSGRRPAYRQGITKHDDYDGFVEKFKPKKTTDDCYTPQPVYDAVVGWLCERADIAGREIVRPFWPGGDYERYDYPAGCVVIDNPPFSIISKIARFYMCHGIRFFLFAPLLTLFGTKNIEWTGIICNETIVYENGAKVNTAFISNLFGDIRVMTAPDLTKRLAAANKERPSVELPKYAYPDCVTSAGLLQKIARHVELVIRASECRQISRLDCQKGTTGIYGGGLLLSAAATARKITAERIAVEKVAAERIAAERIAAEKAAAHRFGLSEREKRIMRSLE